MVISPDHLVRLIPSNANSLYVAYSGGMDSHVLLHILAQTSYRTKLTAVYINHGLQTQADDWERHCGLVCEQLQVRFKVIRVSVLRKSGVSLEEAARNARYDAFKQIMSSTDVLLTGQHRDDQAETFLLQVLRGSGVAGLASMPVQTKFAAGEILRPLLHFSRTDILEYAQANRLLWVEDPSNLENNFDRNYLRHHIIPLLRMRWPAVDKTIARSAEHCAEALCHVNAFAELHLSKLMGATDVLDWSLLIDYEFDHQLLLIRAWLLKIGLRPPSQAVTKAILQQVVHARVDSEPSLSLQGFEVRRYRNKLYCIASRLLGNPCEKTRMWPKAQQSILLANASSLFVESARQGIKADLWRDKEVVIKPRQGGEKLRLPYRQGRHELKKLYQEAGIPPWERDMRPIVYLDGKIAAVAGLWVDEEFWGENIDCIQLNWQAD